MNGTKLMEDGDWWKEIHLFIPSRRVNLTLEETYRISRIVYRNMYLLSGFISDTCGKEKVGLSGHS